MLPSFSRFVKAKTFTPVLNTNRFDLIFGGKEGSSLFLDDKGLMRHIETIAFPETKFEVLQQINNRILRIQTKDYPYQGSFFIDKRFVEDCPIDSPDRKLALPSSSSILDTMRSILGIRYFWGGNSLGVPEMLTFYPPQTHPLDELVLKDWTLQGVDCTGLMYFATSGYTPRNTSSWFSYGTSVPIENRPLDQIITELKPLDAILWPGHIVFVEDMKHCIESRYGKGVITSCLDSRLQELIINSFTPKNCFDPTLSQNQFVVRRWHPDR